MPSSPRWAISSGSEAVALASVTFAGIPCQHSNRLELQRREIQVGRALGEMEHLYPYHFVRFVVVEHDAGRNLLGLDYGGVVEAQVERVRFLSPRLAS